MVAAAVCRVAGWWFGGSAVAVGGVAGWVVGAVLEGLGGLDAPGLAAAHAGVEGSCVGDAWVCCGDFGSDHEGVCGFWGVV